MIILTKNSRGRGKRQFRRVDVFTYCKGLSSFDDLGWKYHDAESLREELLVKSYVNRN
jgi:hypothetical protein